MGIVVVLLLFCCRSHEWSGGSRNLSIPYLERQTHLKERNGNCGGRDGGILPREYKKDMFKVDNIQYNVLYYRDLPTVTDKPTGWHISCLKSITEG